MASSRPLLTLRPPASGPPAQGGIGRAGPQLISGPTWRLVGLDLWTMSSVVTPFSDWSRLTGHGCTEPQHNEVPPCLRQNQPCHFTVPVVSYESPTPPIDERT